MQQLYFWDFVQWTTVLINKKLKSRFCDNETLVNDVGSLLKVPDEKSHRPESCGIDLEEDSEPNVWKTQLQQWNSFLTIIQQMERLFLQLCAEIPFKKYKAVKQKGHNME